MPWLIMDKVLFFHVPRCGGTSLTKHHRVGQKARRGMNPYYKFGLIYYYYRYALLEHANFPLFTYENLLVVIQITIAVFVYFFVTPTPPAPYVMWAMATVTFTMSTIIWTAPVTMRNNTLRWLLMMFQSKVLCGFGGETKYMTGTTSKGYLFHITAKRALKFGYVTREQVGRCSFSIVRNPYSRVVSMFEYNKRPFESFEHFVKCFYNDYKEIYIGKNTCECKDIYCHILPMHEYTHENGEQIVACVVKQEHLKRLLSANWEGSNVPIDIQKALTGIPHTNKRTRRVAWQQYYTQATMDMVYEMYKLDFEYFGYDTSIPNRPDLSIEESVPTPTSFRLHATGRNKRKGDYSKMADSDDTSIEIELENGDSVQGLSSFAKELPDLDTNGSHSTTDAGQPSEENLSDELARREASVFLLATS